MGVSVSAASAIMFTTFVILFAVIFGAVDHFQKEILTAQELQTEHNTDLSSMSFYIESVNSTMDQIVLVNDGATLVDLDDIDVLVNGVVMAHNMANMTVEGHPETAFWGPSERITIQADQDLDGKRIKVTVKGWISAYYD